MLGETCEVVITAFAVERVLGFGFWGRWLLGFLALEAGMLGIVVVVALTLVVKVFDGTVVASKVGFDVVLAKTFIVAEDWGFATTTWVI